MRSVGVFCYLQPETSRLAGPQELKLKAAGEPALCYWQEGRGKKVTEATPAWDEPLGAKTFRCEKLWLSESPVRFLSPHLRPQDTQTLGIGGRLCPPCFLFPIQRPRSGNIY